MNIKKILSCLIVSGCFAAILCLHAEAQSTNKNQDTIHLADPTIFYNKGVYYLYGTVEGNSGNGFIAYTSKDMKRWVKSTTSPDGWVLKKGEAYGTKGFWAPQVFQQKDSFYMAYVADENIAIATSGSPAGPFTQKIIKQLDAPIRQIDPFVFIDEDGKKYLYHVRLTGGNKIFVAEMEADLSAIKPATLKECITATDAWENTANTNWPVTEGPSVLKHNNFYYLFYTANDFRNPDYAVGYATSSSPYGPWKKYAGNPIISKNMLGVNGTGHGDFVMDATHQLTYVFHTHFSATKPTPRRTAIIQVKFENDETSGIDKLVVDKGSFRYAVTVD
ncbi:MAG: beta-xylosidase [Ferruginibacter sp.]|uniref:glycoside hydrolase family 43 protein n=1 Tax=Ferruginibacter sp. TaxID=1940288 RepID=UPI002657AD9E|nr:glycoside hydrolase family 43 protein [Ferruginibacter sp.]MDB5278751.1 beta-xylosidase [Ferruginibacter sp.]